MNSKRKHVVDRYPGNPPWRIPPWRRSSRRSSSKRSSSWRNVATQHQFDVKATSSKLGGISTTKQFPHHTPATRIQGKQLQHDTDPTGTGRTKHGYHTFLNPSPPHHFQRTKFSKPDHRPETSVGTKSQILPIWALCVSIVGIHSTPSSGFRPALGWLSANSLLAVDRQSASCLEHN